MTSSSDSTLAFLRGINVGGHRKVHMATLREALAAAGVVAKTYIQSGNLWLGAAQDAAQPALTAALAQQLDTPVPIAWCAPDAAQDALQKLPVADADPKRLQLGLVAQPLTPQVRDALASLATADHGEERLWTTVAGLAGAVWLHTPDGIGRSKLGTKVARVAGLHLTFRNVATLRKTLALAP